MRQAPSILTLDFIAHKWQPFRSYTLPSPVAGNGCEAIVGALQRCSTDSKCGTLESLQHEKQDSNLEKLRDFRCSSV